ncbi:unnamed protein product [Parnassius mnemosyne]|uniref:eIF-4F 25 kDa subunit n=1 Tax=Parnassius mnemosyne TaxID=213953 RepID=A0AAV1MBH6_9NEOP
MACQPKRSETVVIHELLAFVQQKLDVMDQVSLEQILMTSFTEDEIIQAKKVLADSAVSQIRLITRHRDGRGKKDLQDIFRLFNENDPDDIPTFVARDFNKLPPVKNSEGLVIEGVKHPLQNTWSFWMFTNKNKSWEQNLVKLATFDTVEDYWCLYHHMKTPSELEFGQDYSIFKEGIRPMWEDDANRHGGRWLIGFDRKNSPYLDNIWLFTVLLLIGETLENADEICGVVVSVRAKCKIGIWVKNAGNEKAVLEIGNRLKSQLGLDAKIKFHNHNRVHNIYTI